MKKNQVPLFATPEDWSHLIAAVSSRRPLKLVKAGLFNAPLAQVFTDMNGLDPLSIYLALDQEGKITMREVPQREGGAVKYSVDQAENPDSVSLHIGGMVGEKQLLAGQIGTIRSESGSQELYAEFAREIKRTFSKVKSYYVGPQALNLLAEGVRLSPTAKSSSTYDLVK